MASPASRPDFSDDDTNDSGPPWTSRTFVLSAAVVALLLLATVFVIWATGDDDDDPAAQPEPAATSTTPEPTSPATEPAPEGESVCGLEGGGDTLPEAAPAATWELIGQIAAPVDSEYGPGATTEGGLRYCYQRSPEGALIAATTTLAQAQDPELIVELTEAQLTGDEDVLADAKAQAEDFAADRTPQSPFQVEGFNYVNYTDQQATIELVMRDNQSAMAAVMTVRWVDGDWKLVLNPQGQIFASARRDTTIDATPWSP